MKMKYFVHITEGHTPNIYKPLILTNISVYPCEPCSKPQSWTSEQNQHLQHLTFSAPPGGRHNHHQDYFYEPFSIWPFHMLEWTFKMWLGKITVTPVVSLKSSISCQSPSEQKQGPHHGTKDPTLADSLSSSELLSSPTVLFYFPFSDILISGPGGLCTNSLCQGHFNTW